MKSKQNEQPSKSTGGQDESVKKRPESPFGANPFATMGAGLFGGLGQMPQFGPQQFMQMLPLLSAMGEMGRHNFPGMDLAKQQVAMMSWALETWIDSATAMQGVLQRSLASLPGAAAAAADEEEGGKKGSAW